MDFLEIVVEGSIDMDPDDLEEAISEAFAGIGEITSDEGPGLELDLVRDLPDDDVLERFFGLVDDLGLGDAVKVRGADDDDWVRLSDWQA